MKPSDTHELRARHAAACTSLTVQALSLRLCGVLATRPHSAILIRQTLSLKISLCNGRPCALSAILKSDKLKYDSCLHGLFLRHNLTLQVIIRQCCTVSDGIIYSVCATRLLGLLLWLCLVRQRFSYGISSHGISHWLATPIEPRGNTSQQPLSKDQPDFSSRESTLDFSSGFSQPAFLNGDFHQAFLICCFASSHPFHRLSHYNHHAQRTALLN